MATVDVEIKGINRVRNALRTLAALKRSVLDPEMKEWAQGVRRLLKSKPYPAKRQGQTYQRTGRFANSWAVDPKGAGVWSVVNRANYSGWVVGDKPAWMHLGRWWQARPTIEAEIPKLTKSLSNKIESIWTNGG